MKKRMLGFVLMSLFAVAMAAGVCDDAYVASQNVSKAADNFEVNRRVVFFNGITDTYLLAIVGKCSITADVRDDQLEVICKVGETQYKKHFLGLSDNVSYFVEQIDPIAASAYHYRVTFKPQTIIPAINFRGDAGEIGKTYADPGSQQGG